MAGSPEARPSPGSSSIPNCWSCVGHSQQVGDTEPLKTCLRIECPVADSTAGARSFAPWTTASHQHEGKGMPQLILLPVQEPRLPIMTDVTPTLHSPWKSEARYLTPHENRLNMKINPKHKTKSQMNMIPQNLWGLLILLFFSFLSSKGQLCL